MKAPRVKVDDASAEPVGGAVGGAAWLAHGRIPALDGLRAVGVLLVILSHAAVTRGFPVSGSKAVLGRLGTVGVDVFFVLSGFLITSLLCRERDRSSRISLGAFYVRRVLRIVPAYVCFLLFVAALSFTGRAAVARADWLAAATYTMNFRAHPAWEVGHIWSLSIEEHFYLLWPPLFAFLPRRAAIVGLAGVLLFEAIVRIAILSWSPAMSVETELWTFTRLDPIAAGCLLALISRSPAGFRSLEVVVRRWPVAAALVIAATAGSMLSGKFEMGVAPSLSALALAALVWSAIRSEPRWLETRLIVTIGVGSYSLYLWQEVFLNPGRLEWWTRFPQNLAFVALFAALSYRLIEQPFVRIKQRRATR